MRLPKAHELLVLLALSLGACTAVPRPALDSGAVAEQTPQAAAEDWREVLQRFVDAEGRIDFAGLGRDRAALDRYVAYVYAIGPNNRPDLFPDRDHRLAYYINAYNALAMYGVIQQNIPDRIGGGVRLLGFFVHPHFKLGEEPINLFDLERRVIIPLGEPRAHFALNCMVRDCPRLPREPFTGAGLQAELDTEARRFFGEARNLTLASDGSEVTLNEILRFYRDEFEGAAGSLPAFINRYRDPPLPADIRIRFRPYNWTVNRQPGT